jgi:threonine 3-dehydrogenase
LFVIELAWLFGASVVVGLEPNPYRRGLAEERGALTIDPTAGDPGGRCSELALRRGGFDIAFEVSGVDGMVPFLLKMLRPEGMAVTVGHPSSATAIDIAQYINKRGVILKGVFGRRIWGSWELALDIILSGRIDPCRVVTHRLGLSDAEEAIDLLRTGAGKVILKPKSVSA